MKKSRSVSRRHHSLFPPPYPSFHRFFTSDRSAMNDSTWNTA